MSACAKNRVYVKTPDSGEFKTIAITRTSKGKAPRPYIVNGEKYYPLPNSHGFMQTGKASWYGRAFHGRKTANGEIYNMYKNTAAHKILPMGTYVKVLNLSNHKYVIVRINDRGPFVKGRIIDLSYAAAKKLRIIGPGVADVKIMALGREIGGSRSKEGYQPLVKIDDLENGDFTVQVGAFQEKDNADKLADRLKVIFEYVDIAEHADERSRIFYKVHVSKSRTLTQAGEMEKKLKDMGFSEAFIVRI